MISAIAIIVVAWEIPNSLSESIGNNFNLFWSATLTKRLIQYIYNLVDCLWWFILFIELCRRLCRKNPPNSGRMLKKNPQKILCGSNCQIDYLISMLKTCFHIFYSLVFGEYHQSESSQMNHPSGLTTNKWHEKNNKRFFFSIVRSKTRQWETTFVHRQRRSWCRSRISVLLFRRGSFCSVQDRQPGIRQHHSSSASWVFPPSSTRCWSSLRSRKCGAWPPAVAWSR